MRVRTEVLGNPVNVWGALAEFVPVLRHGRPNYAMQLPQLAHVAPGHFMPLNDDVALVQFHDDANGVVQVRGPFDLNDPDRGRDAYMAVERSIYATFN
jgi:hypothetical protein